MIFAALGRFEFLRMLPAKFVQEHPAVKKVTAVLGPGAQQRLYGAET